MKRDFYVGYLPFPAGLKPLFRLLVPVILLIALGTVYLIAEKTPDTGTGTWALDTTSVTGTIVMEPYPMLITEDRRDSPILLVQLGKMSAHEIVAPYAGQSVELTGFMIERGPWQMLEIEGSESVQATAATKLTLPIASETIAVSLQGEIVDSKCMLGVMKPGAGKVHRDCAELCIMGGMPPMLLVKNEDGDKAAYLLVDENGEAVGTRLLPHIAVPVQVSGSAFRLGKMPVIQVQTKNVQALKGEVLTAFGSSIGLAGTSSFCRIAS